MKTEKKKLTKTERYVRLAVFNLIWYAIAVLVISSFDHTVPAELTVGWYAAWTGELGYLFGVKKLKAKESEE